MKPTLVAAVAGVALLLSTACSDKMNPDNTAPSAPELLRRVQLANNEPMSPQASRALEKLVLTEYLRGASEEQRASVMALLEGSMIQVQHDASVPRTEEIKTKWALIDALLSLRTKRVRMEQQASNPPLDTTGRLKLQVMLVEELKDRTADVMVFRRADDDGRPTILIRNSSFTAVNLNRALIAATRSVSTHGAKVLHDTWVSVHASSSSLERVPTGFDSETFEKLRAEKSSLPEVTLPGIGRGKLLLLDYKLPRQTVIDAPPESKVRKRK